MSAAIIIPARFASSRYPGKPLVELTGATGERASLIERSWRAATSVSGISEVAVATDDPRIERACIEFGARVIMTSPDCQNGTERCAEAMAHLTESADIVVNLQGDAPLTPAWFIEDLVAGLRDDPKADVATPVLRCDGAALNGFLDDRKAGRVGGTTAVFDANKHGLYFSKEVIPFTTKHYEDADETPVFHHVGVYAFRPSALDAYPNWPVGPLERLEGLEQLRFLENGNRILCVEVEARGRQFWELNNPEDVPRLEKMMAEMGIA
ncbi:3-deoxy-manno-octulosonate cytidylyltransferase [Litoreibacter roseus]|uniref:3-deoxy-manno-octulosonate cytidylyltransferase n=1 Tax=Litoreibacter roseus TaxID=2601869 RepID=A0A6N6JH80_9RHOB|nr:manno-octulosonate cytidylyltransferase [Litoreibacter roseus]GFE64572.1 3-deoxy-manno-octulosonate cytidylyltransferase [Litoreibacter roseus]